MRSAYCTVGTDTYPANTNSTTISTSHTALSHTAAPYLYLALRVSGLAQDSHFAGSAAAAADLLDGDTKHHRGPVESGSQSPCCFLLASIRTDPWRIVRLGPLRYRAHGLMLLACVGLDLFHLFCRHLAATPNATDTTYMYFCSPVATETGHVNQIRQYKPPITRLSQNRNNGT
jgi:hypothetical protein